MKCLDSRSGVHDLSFMLMGRSSLCASGLRDPGRGVVSEICYPDDGLGIASLGSLALSILLGGFINQ